MITGIYAGLLGLLIVWMTLQVVKQRRLHRVSLGDGGVDSLQQVISAHNNLVQYSPIMLLLLFLFEYQNGNIWLIHLTGAAFLLGRILHFRALTTTNFKQRIISMQLTLFPIIGLCLLNIGLPFYAYLF